MFKKNDMTEIKMEAIIRFFDVVAEQELFKNSEINQEWIWGKLQFIIDFFNHNNLERISQEKLMELIFIEKHKLFFTERNHDFTKVNALNLDEIIEAEPIVKSLSNVLSSAWPIYFSNQYKKETSGRFSKKHLFSILNICAISFILMGIFYLWQSYGAISILGITGIFAYQALKKFVIAFKNHKQQKKIMMEVKKSSKDKNVISTKMIDDLGLEPWTIDRDINDEMRRFKNKTLHFLSIYNSRERNRHPAMVLDVERMWLEHIPLFIDQSYSNPEHKDLIIKTIQSMENVLQKHIEALFWNDGLEISAKQRFWLAKETEKNI